MDLQAIRGTTLSGVGVSLTGIGNAPSVGEIVWTRARGEGKNYDPGDGASACTGGEQ